MKFRCERDVLLEAFNNAQRATSARAALPVLSGLRLQLSGDDLQVTGSDLDMTITTQLAVSGEGDGAVVLRAAKLAVDILRHLEPGAVTIDASGDKAQISSGRSRFELNAIPADEYPSLSEPVGDRITIAAHAFEDGLKQVVRAASQDESRPILTGVQIAAEGQGLRMVSTDSYRLAVRDLPGTAALREGESVLVPSRALTELTKVLRNDEQLTLVLGERAASFEADSIQLTTRLIEGDFPSYRTLIPQSQPNQLRVERLAFLDAVRRVRLMAQESSPIKVRLCADSVELTANTADIGEASESIDASYVGDEMTVAFNPEYLVDGLEICPGDEISLNTTDELKPALIRPVDSDDFLYLLMPVRVS